MRKVGSDTRGGVGYSGFDSLSVANERMQQSLDFEKRSAAQRNQIAQNTTQSLQVSSQGQAGANMNAIAAKADADVRKIEADARPGGGAIGQIAQAISGAAQTYMNVKAKDRELDVAEHNLRQDIAYKEQKALDEQAELAAKAQAEALKAQREANFVKANDELKLYIQTNVKEGKLTLETGLNEFRLMGSKIIDKYDIEPDKQVVLANELYENIKTVNGRQMDDLEEHNLKVRAAATDAVQAKITMQLTGILTMAKSDRPEVREQALPMATAQLQDMLSREDLDSLEKLNITNHVLTKLQENYTVGTQEHEEAKALFNNYRKFHAEVAKADALYNNGTWDINQRKAYLEEKAISNRLPVSVVGNYDPNAQSKDAIESLERQKKVRDLNEEAIVDAGAMFDYTVEETGVLAIEMVANPGLVNEMKSSAAYRENPDVKTAIDLAEKYIKYRDLNFKDRVTRQDILTEIRKVQQGGVKYLISQRKAARTPDMTDIMEAALSGTPFTPDESGQMTDEEIAANEGALQGVIQSLQEKAALYDQQMNDRVEELKPYGMANFDFEVLRKTNGDRQKALDARVQTWTQSKIAKPQPAGVGIASPTNAGGKTSAFGGVKSLATWKSPSGKAVMPLKAGVPFGMRGRNMHYGAPRAGGKRKHAGEDIGVPVGTEVVAYVGMTLTGIGRQMTEDGAGYYLTFKGDDGKFHRFMHLKDYSSKVKKGQRVEAGQVLAISGDTGAGEAHIHWEIRTDDGFGANGAIDPLGYMASQQTKTTVLPKPVGNTKSTPSYEPGVIQPRMPAGARPLGMGEYLYKGKIYRFSDGQPVGTPETKINAAKPARAGRTSNNVAMYNNKKVQNYSYGVIAKDTAFLTEVHKMADRLGTSAQWLIDIMGHETANTFSPAIPNNKGAVGLIQFYPGTPETLGTTSSALRKMNRMQQLKYVEKYLTPYKADLGKGVEYVAAAVFGGGGMLENLKKRGGVMIPGGELEGYVKQLGRFVGRRYNTSASRKERLVSSNTHTGYHANCKVCQDLIDNDNPLIAHEAQIA